MPKTIQLATFNATDDVKSTVFVKHLVAIETSSHNSDKCQLHLIGGQKVTALCNPAAVLELVGQDVATITVKVFDVLCRDVWLTVFFDHITAVTSLPGKAAESYLRLTDGRELRVLMSYPELHQRVSSASHA